MSEIEELYKKASDKLISSKTLYEIEQYSNSASLAYYAMFLLAKALLRKIGMDAKTHDGLISLFSLKYVHEQNFSYKVYSYLAAAQSVREDADYSAVDYITQETAEELISQAEEFFDEADKFL